MGRGAHTAALTRSILAANYTMAHSKYAYTGAPISGDSRYARSFAVKARHSASLLVERASRRPAVSDSADKEHGVIALSLGWVVDPSAEVVPLS